MPAADRVWLGGGTVRWGVIPAVRYLGHATVVLDLGGQTVVTDPVLGRFCSGLLRVGACHPIPYVDVVVISHLHADHLDLPSLRRLGAPTVLVPAGAGSFVRRAGIAGVREIAAGEAITIGDLRVTGVPANHDGHRWPFLPVTTRADALGYLLEDADHRVYFAGDTDLVPAMTELARPDLALLPVWGWGPDLGPGHLDPERAAQAAAIIRPQVVLPIHWGTFAPAGYARRMRFQLTDPPHTMARFAAELAPGVQVAITEPGAALRRDGVGITREP